MSALASDDTVLEVNRDITPNLKPFSTSPAFSLEFGLQQRVAAAAERLVRRKPVKSLGPAVPEFDRPIQTPCEHQFIGQCQQIR